MQNKKLEQTQYVEFIQISRSLKTLENANSGKEHSVEVKSETEIKFHCGWETKIIIILVIAFSLVLNRPKIKKLLNWAKSLSDLLFKKK